MSRVSFTLGLIMLVGGCVGVGGPKPGTPPHHRVNGFANPALEGQRPSAPLTRWTRTRFFIARIWATTFHPRRADLPRVPNDGAALRDNHGRTTVTWIGHSTLLVQLDGVNLLTDPQWSNRASPVAFAGPRRVTPPGLQFEDLPPIHLVLISHDHYDHLDVATVRRLAQTHAPRFLVPLGLKSWFRHLAIDDVEELDWWESRSLRGLTVTCVPAQHFSGRAFWDRNRRLWSGWTVAGRDKRLFFAGDSGYFPGFKEIGDRLGPFDLTAIPIGGYRPSHVMSLNHTSPPEALRAFADVRGERLVGIHWGTFDLTEEPLDEPPRWLEAEARRIRLDPTRIWVLKPGETRDWSATRPRAPTL